jgi:HEAT repeat protein
VNPFRIWGRDAEDEERFRIARIGELGTLRTIPELLPYLPPGTHRASEGAAKAVERIVRRASPGALAGFDSWCRGGGAHGRGPAAPAWKAVHLEDAPWAAEFPGVLGIASCHESGFVREIAVQLLARIRDGFEMPFLLVRAGDWAPAVQAAALKALSARVNPSHAMHWVRCLPLVVRLRSASRRREEVAGLVVRIEALLTGRASRSALATGLSGGELAVRRECLRLVRTQTGKDAVELLLEALRDRDPLIANGAAESIYGRLPSCDVGEVLPRMLAHPLSSVRMLGIRIACQCATEASDVPLPILGVLQRALLDGAGCVRELARYQLRKVTRVRADFAAFYRAALSEREGRERTIALEGLAEIGTTEDVPVFREFVRHESRRMRAAAIVGLARCAPSSHLGELSAALEDPSRKVRRAAQPYARLHLGRGFGRRGRRSRARAPTRP